ncbi:hypothetical protein PENSPDRAFT_652784 [Peniophora sp. CONT]|nr:hypothetical protein PENSPDRAFT_652784 [Peniophora sp. CONT]
MGYRTGALLASTCFFCGILFVCFNVDQRILFLPKTEERTQDAFAFYTIFYNAPSAIKALMHGMMGVLVLAIILKLSKWDESAMYFDGGSLACAIFSFALYTSTSIPALRTINEPVPDVDTPEDLRGAVELLGASNVLCLLLMIGIIFLQAGQAWAQSIERKAILQIEEEDRLEREKVSGKAPETKKEK